jgi:hypothetical protein
MNETKKTHSTGRPSAETAEAAWSLLVSAARRRRRYSRIGHLRRWQRPADAHLVIALDAAILAGEDGRMLTTNLVFDALAEPKRRAGRSEQAGLEADVRSAWAPDHESVWARGPRSDRDAASRKGLTPRSCSS